MYISFVVPVLNEKDNVAQLHSEIVAAAKKIGKSYEIIFVDDGSSDGTQKEIKKQKGVRLIEMRRNFGQTAALDAGIKAATGKYLVTLDGDLQNDPADVPAMLKLLHDEDLDVVCGWRYERRDDPVKRFISAGARELRSILVEDGVHDSGCTLRVYQREAFDDLDLRGEMHRFIPAMLKWRGFKIGEMKVNHRPRIHGHSKYNMRRTFKGFLDMLSLWFFRKYASRPLHFLGAIGLGCFGVGVVLGGYLAVGRLIGWFGLAQSIWPLVAVFLVLFGMQMFVSGLIMDLVMTSGRAKNYFTKTEN